MHACAAPSGDDFDSFPHRACGQRPEVEEGKRLLLAGHRDHGVRIVDVEALGAALLRIVAAAGERFIVEDRLAERTGRACRSSRCRGHTGG